MNASFLSFILIWSYVLGMSVHIPLLNKQRQLNKKIYIRGIILEVQDAYKRAAIIFTLWLAVCLLLLFVGLVFDLQIHRIVLIILLGMSYPSYKVFQQATQVKQSIIAKYGFPKDDLQLIEQTIERNFAAYLLGLFIFIAICGFSFLHYFFLHWLGIS